MTRQQRRVLLAMQAAEAAGQPATLEEIGKRCGGFSKVNAHRIVQILVRDGYATRLRDGDVRCYRVIKWVKPIVEWRVWDDTKKALVRLGEGANDDKAEGHAETGKAARAGLAAGR